MPVLFTFLRDRDDEDVHFSPQETVVYSAIKNLSENGQKQVSRDSVVDFIEESGLETSQKIPKVVAYYQRYLEMRRIIKSTKTAEPSRKERLDEKEAKLRELEAELKRREAELRAKEVGAVPIAQEVA